MNAPAVQNGVDSAVELSVLIPTRNGGPLFQQVMSAVEQQVFDGPVEYMIVDSGSVDGTDSAAAARGWRVIRIDRLHFHHGRTRNLGVSRTRGRYVVLMTQDAVPADRFVFQRLVAPFSDPEVGGVCARQIPRPDADPVTCRQMAGWPASSPQGRVSSARTVAQLRQLPPHEQYMQCRFDNVCGALRRETWTRHPFPENDFGEDLAWGHRVVCGGWKICYQPQAAVLHSHDRSPLYEFRRAYCFAWQIDDLFAIRHFPTPLSAAAWALSTVRGDLDFLSATALRRSEKWRTGIRSTLRTLAVAAGQYRGARDRRRNVKKVTKGI